MKTYLLTSGQEQWLQPAPNVADAIELAFKRRPPKALGALVMIGYSGYRGHWTTLYLDSEKALKIAGFKVRKSRKHETAP